MFTLSITEVLIQFDFTLKTECSTKVMDDLSKCNETFMNSVRENNSNID